jgi:protein transport protein SEC31
VLFRFYDIAWGPPTDDHPQGIIAGALANGALDLWDAEKLINGSDDALIARTEKHSGPIKSLQFNPLRPQILATAGAKGELFIYDVNDPSNAFRLGNAAARSDDLECVAWNRKVSHILATGGSGGFVTVWDLKTKKASLTLNNNRKAVSAIAWDPNNSTKLLTATPDDNSPLILLWDLRNSNAPEKTLQGHEQGILSLSWCQQDDELLLSCGKDNRTLIWNPRTGQRFGEFPEVTNWTFSTRFHPQNPNLSATAAFDGKITIQTLQNTNPTAVQSQTQSNLDGEDFFTQAQTQPQEATFSLPKAPRWFERPVGASFGFGGKLIMLRQVATQPGQKRVSKIEIVPFSVDSDIGTATDNFEESLREGNLAAICESHKEQAKTDEEKAEWRVMETLLAENPRKQIVEYLGFSQEDEKPEEATNGTTEGAETKEETAAEPAKLAPVKGHKKNRLSMFFSDNAEGEDDFLASLSATKGAKTDNPFHLFADSDTTVEKSITKALMLGDFEKATGICLKEGRMADAFMIANCGGKELVDSVQSAYLAQKTGMPSYLRLLSSVIVKNLWDVVYNADLADWKETMVTLCTYASPTEFADLCEALGDRILESGSRQDAAFCYLVGSKLEKVVGIWITELEEAENAGVAEGNDTSFSVHARTLQQFIEKVTVFRAVTKFQDGELTLPSDWKLAALYDKYTEYADIVAGHGQLAVAQKYLDLLPNTFPAADVARNRLKLATQKKVQPVNLKTGPASRAPTASLAYQAPVQPTASPLNPYQSPAGAVPPANPYAPPQPTASPYAPQGVVNPYAPPQPASNPYAPSGFQPVPTPSGYVAPAPGYGPPPTAYGPGAPPRAGTPSSVPPPPRAKDVGDWNDVPIVTRAMPAKRSTPAAITSPFPNQPLSAGPPQSPYGAPPRGTATPPPPPPKVGQRVTSPLGGPPQAGQLPPPRPGSTSTNPYAPPLAAQAHPSMPPPMGNIVPKSGSPYNAPPGGQSNRYAPAPAAQTVQPPPQAGMAPPPGSRPPPPNPYASGPPPIPGQSPYGASPYEAPQQQSAPPPGPPPMGGPPRGGPPRAAGSPATAPPPSSTLPKAKHPAGDRSHIPASAQPLVDILNRDMQRVASKAPASFAPQVKDTQKRLNLLFDHLNNEELVKPDTVEQLIQLAQALEGKNYPEAQRLQVEVQTTKTDECGNWMVSVADSFTERVQLTRKQVGVKRLVSMSKATP